jgi:hypothetical protein
MTSCDSVGREMTQRTQQCPGCHTTVPAEVFCSACGAYLDRPVTLKHTLLRPSVFAAAPRQPITLPLVTSSLFPRLTDSSRMPFRLALFLGLAALVICSWLRLVGPLVIVTAFGIPLLFVVYLWQSDAFADIEFRALALAIAVGVGTGVGWWLWAGVRVANSYGVPLGVGAQLQDSLNLGMIVTVVGALLMVAPAIVVRLLGWTSGESLDGFVIGALGSLSHAAAGTITWFAPQFTAGLLQYYSPTRLFEEAFLYGLVDPITAAAAGGLIGLELWFRPNRRALRHPGRLRAALAIFTVLVLSLYIGVYAVDAAALPMAAEVGINAVLMALVLLTLRCAVQMALLHEEPDAATARPVPCPHCEQTVPDTAFCQECGAAARASSRAWRRRRWTLSGADRPAS